MYAKRVLLSRLTLDSLRQLAWDNKIKLVRSLNNRISYITKKSDSISHLDKSPLITKGIIRRHIDKHCPQIKDKSTRFPNLIKSDNNVLMSNPNKRKIIEYIDNEADPDTLKILNILVTKRAYTLRGLQKKI
jgi:hypothetical protein